MRAKKWQEDEFLLLLVLPLMMKVLGKFCVTRARTGTRYNKIDQMDKKMV